MTPTREDLELYVSGNYDGDVAALEHAIDDDPALGALLAEEARFDALLRDAAHGATFCPACEDLVRGERCDSCGAAVRPGGYVVERVLVSNAHGRMYVAHDADGKRVALKELAFVHAPSPAAVAAFEREARFLRALEHPAIPRFCASFEEGEGVHTRYYLAQELVEGKALDQLDDHWYSEAEIVDIAKQVLEVLVYLQALSPMVIHRDIKPANLLKRPDGSIALVDFGAAHVHGTTAGVTTVGTFGYMPIEQLAGVVDATTDCYALGATLLYLLTRQEPWRLAQTKTSINVSAPLRAYLDKLTASDPRDRFQAAKDALAALDRRDALVVAKPAKRRWPWRPALAAVAGVLVTLGGVGLYSYEQAHKRHHGGGAYGGAGYGGAGYGGAGYGGFSIVPGAPPWATMGLVKFSLPQHQVVRLLVDGKQLAYVQNGSQTAVLPGKHEIKLIGDNGTSCLDQVTVQAGKTTTLECTLGVIEKEPPPPEVPVEPRLKNDKQVSWTFKQSPFHDVMKLAAETCGFNIVVPDYLRSPVTIDLTNVDCDQAVEVALESQGLWYTYDPAANLVRVAPRKDLAAEAEAALTRPDPAADELLPPGNTVDVDVKNAPLADVLRMIARNEHMNIVIPDFIRARVTVTAHKAPWHTLFERVLESNGLWYRYRKTNKIISIAARKDLDAQDE